MIQSFKQLLAKSEKNGGTTLVEHTNQVVITIEKIASKLNLPIDIAREGAIIHDLGKAHPQFQNKLLGAKTDWINNRLEIPLRHEIASLLFLSIFDQTHWDYIIEMVIGHHKSIKSLNQSNNSKGILDLINDYGEDAIFETHSAYWEQWSNYALDIIRYYGYKVQSLSIEEAKISFVYVISNCENMELGWSQWRGLLNASDHFASALADKTSSKLTGIYTTPNLRYFFNPERANKLYHLSYVSSSDPRPHTLITAPTGAGKTDYLIKRCKGRIFYTLPFQASINAMYKRLKEACPSDDVRVLHASSRLIVKDNDIQEEKVLQSLTGAAIKILTPYQIASVVLGTKGYEAIAIDLKGNDIILDEIHSYNATSMALVFQIIKTLLFLDCRIHIGTATMPSVLSKMIYDLLGKDKNVYKINFSKKQLASYNRHTIFKIENDDSVILEIINKGIKENKKILIVVNRVNKAQELYKELKKTFNDIPHMLLHSRFKRSDRAIHEEEISKFNESKNSCIVVSTQVVEVSLDISFDLMITDAAPLDSMIQRFGRINRKRNKDTVGKLKDIYVLKPSDDRRDSLPYNYDVVKKSFDLLPDGKLLKESDVQFLIDDVYPSINIASITSHSILDDEGIRITKLCDYPKSILLESLNIDSACCIVESDLKQYEYGNNEKRLTFEIPISIKTTYSKKFTSIGRLDYGSYPFVIPDYLYDENIGLNLLVVENIL